eukprot:8644296-Heterocapsa_arctica.AAC.1
MAPCARQGSGHGCRFPGCRKPGVGKAGCRKGPPLLHSSSKNDPGVCEKGVPPEKYKLGKNMFQNTQIGCGGQYVLLD